MELIKNYIKMIRVHQWIKNSLIFVPFILSFNTQTTENLYLCVIGFIVFCFTASSIYILNDIVDIESDRKDRIKSLRPIAVGAISITNALIVSFGLLIFAVGMATLLPVKFLYVIVLYFILTVSYSIWLKKIIVLDVMLLAVFYTLRLIAGAIIISSGVTNWLLVFSIFIFFSLSLLKRYSEIISLKSLDNVDQKILGRMYYKTDSEIILLFGVASSLISILVFLLYASDHAIYSKYAHPEWLWVISIVLLYWLTRIWILVSRGVITKDPIVFAIKDIQSYLSATLVLICILLAK